MNAVQAAPTSAESGKILVRGLTRRFGARLALAPLELELGPGGITGLLGPNGSGKSTLLRLLTGLVRPDAGTARVDGQELGGDGTAVRARLAYAPGEIALYGELHGRAMLEFLLRGRAEEARERALELAASLGLPLGARVRTYSHGMKRQLLLAAALAPRVRVRLLDEPTEGLDPRKRGEVLALLAADAARGTTILLSSHHLGEVDRICDRLVFLHQGRKLADETRASVLEKARRLVRLEFAAAPAAAVLQALAGVRAARVEGQAARVELVRDDPRQFLGALAQAGLPAPLAIEYGALSLADLFRELYGVEAC